MAASETIRPVRSILDTDLYKLTMQQAIQLSSISDPQVSYKFTNRSAKDMHFTRDCVDLIRTCIQDLAQLQLTPEEKEWLATNCPYLRPQYLDYLQQFRFQPKEQVHVTYVPLDETESHGHLEISVTGKWSEVILYEVPLMSIVSEAYFRTVDTRWDMTGQRGERACFDSFTASAY